MRHKRSAEQKKQLQKSAIKETFARMAIAVSIKYILRRFNAFPALVAENGVVNIFRTTLPASDRLRFFGEGFPALQTEFCIGG